MKAMLVGEKKSGSPMRRQKARSGQAALEYVIVFALMIAAVYAAIRFMRAPASVASHTTSVICSERL